jgi:hypothetical protein
VAGAGAASLLLVAGLVASSVHFVRQSRHEAQPEAVAVVTVPVETETIDPEPPPVGEPVHMTAAVNDAGGLIPAVPPIEVKQPPTVKEVLNRQRSQRTDEDLRKQLLSVPEIRIERRTVQEIINKAELNAHRSNLRPDQVHFTPDLLNTQADMMGLPWRRGADCQLGGEPATYLQQFSRRLRTALQQAKAKNDTDALAEAVRGCIAEMARFRVKGNALSLDLAEAVIPALMQMLCAEGTAVRLVLVEHLASIDHRTANEALAKLAVFDLSEKVRASAINVLTQRSKKEARAVLLDALRYPWAPAADHAAEALVMLQDRDAVPELRQMLKAPDPKAPYFDYTDRATVVREVVKVNHLANCVMCHAPSNNTSDFVRGKVPTPGEPLPVEYYENPTGIFVRADATYLKQDFSVIQPVDSPNHWPVMQRFDYIVRKRPATSEEVRQARQATTPEYPQREAVRYALRELENETKAPRREEAMLETGRP